MKRLLLLFLAVIGVVLGAPARPASAHPLGNFSVNQYLGLTLTPDRVEATAVVDAAEIPTLQDRSNVDSDRDGTASDAERAAYAQRACADVARSVQTSLSLVWTVRAADFAYAAGAGGLATGRLTCALTAPADLRHPTTLTVENRYQADRVGWREITARGSGVELPQSPVPVESVSDQLRTYPPDLLSSALDVRTVTLRTEPGSGIATPGLAAAGGPAGGPAGRGPAASVKAGGDPVSRWMSLVDRHFQDLAGGPRLTPVVGLLAVLLSLLLGAGHAALPGHGKTVLAAYLAGQRGRPRDALAIGATVTVSHTAGVLAIGLLLASGTALAGETMLRWLGLASGILVLAVGAGMLAGILRRRQANHSHSHVDHDHSHSHFHSHGGHSHSHEVRPGRLGLAGVGLAGGLVPSPSALVVLLGAIGLGRTWFGVMLVVAYGLGMAATLTAAGLLLVAAQRRLARASGGVLGRLSLVANRLTHRLPGAARTGTAALVMVVGLGLAARAATGL